MHDLIPNKEECLILRGMYKKGIQWRSEEFALKVKQSLIAKRLIDHNAEVDLVKVLRFANATEGPPPTRRGFEESEEDKLKGALMKLAQIVNGGR